jgi:hypothetical protein
MSELVGEEIPPEATAVLVPESGEAARVNRVSAADDVRAMASIRRAKGFGGLAGFGLAALAADMHGELMVSVLLRALGGGLVGYMVAWLAAVTVWRRIIRAELARTREQALAARAAVRQADA